MMKRLARVTALLCAAAAVPLSVDAQQVTGSGMLTTGLNATSAALGNIIANSAASVSASGLTMTGLTLSGGTLSGTTTLPGSGAITSGGSLSLGSSQSIGISTDALLFRDGAGVLAQRNGVNGQRFRVYNTFTDASNYERSVLGFTSNTLVIGTEQAGTGVARNVQLIAGGTQVAFFQPGQADFSGTGANSIPAHLLAANSLGTPGQSVELGFYETTNAVQVGAIRSQAVDATHIGMSFSTYASGLTPFMDFGITTSGVLTVNGSVTLASGKALQLGNAYVATPSVSTGYLLISDSSGTVYEMPAKLH